MVHINYKNLFLSSNFLFAQIWENYLLKLFENYLSNQRKTALERRCFTSGNLYFRKTWKTREKSIKTTPCRTGLFALFSIYAKSAFFTDFSQKLAGRRGVFGSIEKSNIISYFSSKKSASGKASFCIVKKQKFLHEKRSYFAMEFRKTSGVNFQDFCSSGNTLVDDCVEGDFINAKTYGQNSISKF